MKEFKFLRGGKTKEIEYLHFETRATASFNDRMRELDEMHRQQLDQLEIERISMIRREDTQIRLSGVTRVTTVNPKPLTKVKMFWQKTKLFFVGCFNIDPTAVIAISILSTILIGISIAKLFGL